MKIRAGIWREWQSYHRLKGYDYTSVGAYFITLVTYQRDEIFGSVVNGEMKPTPLGNIVREEWFRSAAMRREIELFEDEFIIMPNHIHGIVFCFFPRFPFFPKMICG